MSLITSRALGLVTTPEGTIGPCVGHYGVRKRFYLDGIRLEVPDAVIDKQMRWLVDQGMGIADTYATVGWKEFLPEEGMRECCRNILRHKWMDENQQWQLSGWGNTCAGYHACLESYVLAIRETNKRGRMKIATGLYSPSPAEEQCIRLRFAVHSDIARAYSECDLQDILPTFPGAVESLNLAMLADRTKTIKQPMYKMLTAIYQLSSLGPVPQNGHTPHTPPDSDKAGKDGLEITTTFLLIGGGIVLAILLTK